MTESWQWMAVAGLGAFHGLNPAMGWLFAVALGLHKSSFKMVLLALLPIALGHLFAIGLVVLVLLVFGRFLEFDLLRNLCAGLLLLWAIYLLIRGHRGRVRFGMKVSLGGLALWSFLMATSHGAGLMLIPALMPATQTAAHSTMFGEPEDFVVSLAATLLHTLAMLAVALIISSIVYQWLGVALLRQGWINMDRLWIAALLLASVYLLLA